jgi:hypothetical protein
VGEAVAARTDTVAVAHICWKDLVPASHFPPIFLSHPTDDVNVPGHLHSPLSHLPVVCQKPPFA